MDREVFTQQQESGCNICCSNEFGTKQFRVHDSLIDLELAKEMNQLTVQERQKILEEIHGVAEEQEETAEFIASSIKEMDIILGDIPRTQRKALDRAFFLYPNLQNDVKFKLMFLRTDYFDPGKAARRMAKHFEDKLMLFGDAKLVKKITLDDLDEEAKRLFSSGVALELPHRDPTGRPIWFFDPMSYDYLSMKSLLQASWYQIMATMEDEIAQKKGVFNITYAEGNIVSLSKKLASLTDITRRTGDIITSLPARVTSYHFCYEDPRLQALLAIIQKYFGRHLRLRVRTHYGSPIEIEYSMMTFGVSCLALLSGADEIDKQRLRRGYVERRAEIEADEYRRRKKEESETGIILYPNPLDVLVGRGRPYQNFSGNIRLSRVVEGHMDRYWQCNDRFDKTCLFMDLVKTVQEYGGRFLERKASGWVVVNETVARDKVSSGFRTKVMQATTAASSSEPARPDRSAKRMKL